MVLLSSLPADCTAIKSAASGKASYSNTFHMRRRRRRENNSPLFLSNSQPPSLPHVIQTIIKSEPLLPSPFLLLCLRLALLLDLLPSESDRAKARDLLFRSDDRDIFVIVRGSSLASHQTYTKIL